MGNKVKATFSKIQYTETLSGLTSALSVVATLSAATQVKREEVLEEDLTGKTNISDVLKEQYYKFEIYNESIDLGCLLIPTPQYIQIRCYLTKILRKKLMKSKKFPWKMIRNLLIFFGRFFKPTSCTYH